jgi:hypothetical protein
MPPDNTLAYSAAHHPAQHRERVGLTPLFFGLFSGPIVWAGNLMFTYALGAHACYPGRDPLNASIQGFGFAWPLILVSYCVALLVCAAAFAVSLRNWRLTGSESEGHWHHLMEVGEGRTRFLGIIGMAFSLLFFAALVFGIIVLAIVPLCAA